MKPAEAKPECEACGATEGLRKSNHFGWLCNDVQACFDRIGSPGWVRPDGDIHPPFTTRTEPRCRLCGLPDNLERSQYGWVHDACMLADDSEPADYEALGYPDTQDAEWVSAGGLDILPETIELLIGSVLGDIHERVGRIIGVATDNG